MLTSFPAFNTALPSRELPPYQRFSRSNPFAGRQESPPTGLNQKQAETATTSDEFTIPEALEPIAPQKTAWDYLAKTSLTGMALVSGAMVFSPLISKKAAQYTLHENFEQKLANWPQWTRKWAKPLLLNVSQPKVLLQKLNRLASFTRLLQLNTGYQVGINTRQPSKSLSSLMGTFNESVKILKYKIPNMQALSFLSSFFWFSGETNDIRNNNNPGQRREWDQKRLFKALKGEEGASFGQELKHMLGYMGKDFGYTLSFAPWKNLVDSFRNKEPLNKPQPYQTAIGAQINLAAFLLSMAAFGHQKLSMWKKPDLKIEHFDQWPRQFKAIPARLSKASQTIMLFSIISYLPVLMRAFQNKKEADGIITIFGVPLITLGQVFAARLSYSPLQGLFNMGGPIVNEGKRINSQKYRAQVAYLTNLHQQALQNPSLKAATILADLESNSKKLKIMALSMGEFRVHYILDLLRTGAEKQKIENLNFANYLEPLMNMGA